MKEWEPHISFKKKKKERKDIISKAATSALGLDLFSAENAIALAVSLTEEPNYKIIQSQKEQHIKKSEVLEYIDTDLTLDDVGGFDYLKSWLEKRKTAFGEKAKEYGINSPKGMLLIGLPGCLTGDTKILVKRGKRTGGREYSLKTLFYKFNGKSIPHAGPGGNIPWDASIPSYTMSCIGEGKTIFNKISKVVYSGFKNVFKIKTALGKEITATEDHLFLTSVNNGKHEFTELKDLKIGNSIIVFAKNTTTYAKGRTKGRRMVETAQFHPFGFKNVKGGKNYKRLFYAKCVVEAALNNLDIKEFIQIIRKDPAKAAKLTYLEKNMVVHHIDGNVKNDSLDNLKVLTKLEHDTFHGVTTSYTFFGTEKVTVDSIVEITPRGITDVYDISLEDDPRNFRANGIFVHNCGKSHVAKSVASFFELPLLRLDISNVYSRYVGDSESRIKRALSIIEAIAPVVVIADEADKAFSGMESSGKTDSGVTARVLSTLLTWRQETKSPVFMIFTANDPDMMPPMVYRKGRLDEVWAVDLPSAEERQAIFKIHIEKRKRESSNYDLFLLAEKSNNFTGAEIEATIEDALFNSFYEGVELETRHILKSISETNPQNNIESEDMVRIKEWMKNRARPVSNSDVTPETPKKKTNLSLIRKD
jgi:ATP-dependent 26S proteasome regulatory subunit